MNSESQIYGGKIVDLANPSDYDVDINHIAIALSRQCRFNGNTRKFYSVAQHSLYVASLLPEDIKIYGLLHDAHEAFLGDITTPLANALGLAAQEAINNLKDQWDEAIYNGLNIDKPNDRTKELVRNADHQALIYEANNLMWDCEYWERNPTRDFYALSINDSSDKFLQTYYKLLAEMESWI